MKVNLHKRVPRVEEPISVAKVPVAPKPRRRMIVSPRRVWQRSLDSLDTASRFEIQGKIYILSVFLHADRPYARMQEYTDGKWVTRFEMPREHFNQMMDWYDQDQDED